MSNKHFQDTKINDFLKWANDLGIGEFVYRGVSNEDYIKDKQIEASTCRRLKKREPYDWVSEAEKAQFLSNEQVERPEQLLKINEEMIKDARAQGHDYKDGKYLFDLDLLAELQHYGAATCLIDFTYDAMVALWFACQPSSERYRCVKHAENAESEVTCQLISEKYANGKVVAVGLHRSHKVADTEAEKNIGCFFRQNVKNRSELYHWQPKYQNNRIIAQRSIFMFGSFTFKADAEYIIPAEDKSRILFSLERIFGKTEASLYPDFDGFATQRAHDKEYTSTNVSGYIEHADKALQSDNFDEAIRLCTEGISLQPDNIDVGFLLIRRAEAHSNKGEQDNNKGEQDDAIEDCNKVIKLHESDYMPFHLKLSLNLRAQIYENRDEHDLAIQDYDKIIEVYSKDAEAHYNLGRVKKHLKCIAEAKDDLQKALKLANQKRNVQVYVQVKNKEELIENITQELDDLE